MKITFYFALLTALLVVGCSKSNSPVSKDQAFFEFPFSTMSIYTGEIKKLELNRQSTNYNRSEIKFVSANENIATIDESNIKALAEGEVIIKAVKGKMELGRFNLSVTDAQVTAISFPNATFSINVNQTYSIRPTLTPVFAVDKAIVWSSSDSAIASVNSNGSVKGLTTGTTDITATTKTGLAVHCAVTVK